MIANRDSIETSERFPRQAPSERDLQVYAAVRVDGRRQVDVAAEFGLSQGRVSQIVRCVNQWRAGLGIDAELERRDRKSVDRWLEQLRIEKLYEETMELFRRSQSPRRKERRGKSHRGEWTTETLDHQPGNLQCLKLAARLIELKRQLDEDPPRPDQSSSSPRSHMDEYEAFRFLVDLRNDAVRRGDVPEADDSEVVVRRMIRELTGQKPHVSPWEQQAQVAREAEVNAAAACLMAPPVSSAGSAEPVRPCDVTPPIEVPPGRRDLQPAGAPANISDISADAATDEATGEAATACPAATSAAEMDADPRYAEPVAAANNRDFFSLAIDETLCYSALEREPSGEPPIGWPVGSGRPAVR